MTMAMTMVAEAQWRYERAPPCPAPQHRTAQPPLTTAAAGTQAHTSKQGTVDTIELAVIDGRTNVAGAAAAAAAAAGGDASSCSKLVLWV